MRTTFVWTLAALAALGCFKRSAPPTEPTATVRLTEPPVVYDSQPSDPPTKPDITPDTKKPSRPTRPKVDTPIKPEGSWKETRSQVGKFVVELPPNGTDDKATTGGIADFFVQVGGSYQGHMIGVASTKRMGRGANEPAKKVAESNAQMPDSKTKKEIELQGHPGVEARSDDGKRVDRCYVTPTRIYIVSVLTQGKGLDQAVADRVFNSFKILD